MINYLLASVSEAYERVFLMRGSLTALVTGDITTLDEGPCRDIWLTADGTSSTPVIKYTISPAGTIYEYDPETDDWISPNTQPIEIPPTPMLTMKQARDILYTGYIDAELFYPGELDKWEGDALFYCFVYYDGDIPFYAYINAMTGEVEIVDKIENYTGEN